MTLPSLTSLVLVAVINNPRDMEIARLLGWYRIPLRSAPKVVAVDYLAFYQTAAFGDAKWQIRFIAPVLGHELVTRAELLREEAKHPSANQLYYKVQVGPLVELPRPIQAERWRRLTFLYTTGEYLLQAETLHDLVVQNEERAVLWQALRERAQQGAYRSGSASNAGDLPDLDLDPGVLAALLGIKELEEVYRIPKG